MQNVLPDIKEQGLKERHRPMLDHTYLFLDRTDTCMHIT